VAEARAKAAKATAPRPAPAPDKAPVRITSAGAATARAPQVPAPGTSAWHSDVRPTRVVNLDAAAVTITQLCAKKDLAISSIERLPSGGTHVVMVTIDGAEGLRAAFKGKVIDGAVKRLPLRERGDGS
jgi:hypothetical protein